MVRNDVVHFKVLKSCRRKERVFQNFLYMTVRKNVHCGSRLHKISWLKDRKDRKVVEELGVPKN